MTTLPARLTKVRIVFAAALFMALMSGTVHGMFAAHQETGTTTIQEPLPPKADNPPAKPDTPPPVEKPAIKRIPGYPPVEQRVADYRLLANSGKAPREESRPYVIEGITVAGIFGTAPDLGAFLKTEDGSTVIVRKGMKMYNGTIVAIEPGRVLFRQGSSKKLIEKRYGQAINAITDEGKAQ